MYYIYTHIWVNGSGGGGAHFRADYRSFAVCPQSNIISSFFAAESS